MDIEIEKVRVAVRIRPRIHQKAGQHVDKHESHIIVEENNTLLLLPPGQMDVDYSSLAPQTPKMPHAKASKNENDSQVSLMDASPSNSSQQSPLPNTMHSKNEKKVTPTGLRYSQRRNSRRSSLMSCNVSMLEQDSPLRPHQRRQSAVEDAPERAATVVIPSHAGFQRGLFSQGAVTAAHHLSFTPAQVNRSRFQDNSSAFIPPVTPGFRRGTPRTLLRNVIDTLTPRNTRGTPSHQSGQAMLVPNTPARTPSPNITREYLFHRQRAEGRPSSRVKSLGGTATLSSPHASNRQGRNQHHAPKTFAFDQVFKPSQSQADVFEEVAPFVDAVLQGYNATIFAYGPSGTGKTFSMLGSQFPTKVDQLKEDSDCGMIPRALQRIFDQVEKGSQENHYTVSCTMVELYCDEFSDLLDPNHGKRRLACEKKTRISIREDVQANRVYLTGSEHLCTSVKSLAEALQVVGAGVCRRSAARTDVNDRSSRSHAILTITVHSELKGEDQKSCLGKLHLVDLAGSERLEHSHAEGQTKREACKINGSLSALGDVLSALSSDRYKGPVPYRNSKLTRLLKDSLGGNSKTLFLVHISDDPADFRQNVSSLMYGQRARRIKNLSMMNIQKRQSEAVSSTNQLQSQLEKLQRTLYERNKALHDLQEKENVIAIENTILKERVQEATASQELRIAAHEKALSQVHHEHALMLAEQEYEHTEAEMAVSFTQWHALQLEIQLVRSTEAISSLQSAVDRKDEAIIRLERAHHEAEVKRRAHKKQLKKLYHDRQRAKLKLEEAKQALQRMQTEHAAQEDSKTEEQERQHEEQLQKIADMKEELETAQAELEEARQNADEEASAAQDRAEQLAAELDERRAELDEIQLSLQAKEQESDELQGEVDTLRAELSEINERFEALQRKEAEEKKELEEKLEKERTEAQDMLASRLAEVDRLVQERVEAAKAEAMEQVLQEKQAQEAELFEERRKRMEAEKQVSAALEEAMVKAKNQAEEEARWQEEQKRKTLAEQVEAEKQATMLAAKVEAERLTAAAKAEAARVAEETKKEMDRLIAARLAMEKLAAEQAEAEKLALARVEAERLAAAERAEEKRKAEAERILAESRAEEERRLIAERAETERLVAEAERLVAERRALEEERLSAERMMAERHLVSIPSSTEDSASQALAAAEALAKERREAASKRLKELEEAAEREERKLEEERKLAIERRLQAAKDAAAAEARAAAAEAEAKMLALAKAERAEKNRLQLMESMRQAEVEAEKKAQEAAELARAKELERVAQAEKEAKRRVMLKEKEAAQRRAKKAAAARRKAKKDLDTESASAKLKAEQEAAAKRAEELLLQKRKEETQRAKEERLEVERLKREALEAKQAAELASAKAKAEMEALEAQKIEAEKARAAQENRRLKKMAERKAKQKLAERQATKRARQATREARAAAREARLATQLATQERKRGMESRTSRKQKEESASEQSPLKKSRPTLDSAAIARKEVQMAARVSKAREFLKSRRQQNAKEAKRVVTVPRVSDTDLLEREADRENRSLRANQIRNRQQKQQQKRNTRVVGARKLQRELGTGRTPQITEKVQRRRRGQQKAAATPLVIAVPAPRKRNDVGQKTAMLPDTPAHEMKSAKEVVDHADAIPDMVEESGVSSHVDQASNMKVPQTPAGLPTRALIGAGGGDCFLSPATPAAARRAQKLAKRKRGKGALKNLLNGDTSNLLAAAF